MDAKSSHPYSAAEVHKEHKIHVVPNELNIDSSVVIAVAMVG